MATIHKKTWQTYFEQVLSGEKQFDLRLADFEAQPGDTLVLDEWDDVTGIYTGRVIEAAISYVLRTNDIDFWPQKQVEKYGYQVMQLEDIKARHSDKA